MDYQILQKLQKIGKDYYTTADLEKILDLKKEVLYVTLNRMVKKGLLTRLRREVYTVSLFREGNKDKIASQLYWPNYLSFESALSKYGILYQIPYVLTFATSKRTKKMKLGKIRVEFRQIKKGLFFGYTRKEGINIAEPEKALLDQLYLVSLGKSTLDQKELDLKDLKRTKFIKYSKSFPQKTQEMAKDLVKKFGTTAITIR
jgi:predicted transcriptional regulator of viral defense system